MQTNNFITPWDSINVTHEWPMEYASTQIEIDKPQDYMSFIDTHIGDVIIFLFAYVCFMLSVVYFRSERPNNNNNGNN